MSCGISYYKSTTAISTTARLLWIVLAGLLFNTPARANASNEFDQLLAMDLGQLLNTRLTGSHIRQANPLATGPITLIDQARIRRSGATSLEQLLQQLPVSAGYAGNQSNAYWGVNGHGSTHVNLRGLGINRTLVLLDGHRLANGGTGANAAVDLNAIPLAMVERIEIFRAGASAIYGADAVAGVVNIITRKADNRINSQVHYGQTSKGDGAEQSTQWDWGVRTDQGSLMLGLSYFHSDSINMASRAPCALGEVAGKLACVDSGNTIGGRARLANGTRINFNQIPGGDGNFYEPYSASKHNFNANPYINAVNPIERLSLSGKGDYLLNDQLHLFSTWIYTRSEAWQLGSPGSLGINRPINIAANHPTNPTGQNLVLERRRLLEAGTRRFYQDVDYLQGQLELDGQLTEPWHWQSSLGWSRNRGVDGLTNVANLDRVDASLDTSRCSTATGAAIPCADYLGYGDLSQEVLDYLMTETRDHGGNQMLNYSGNLSGDLLELDAGPLQLAAGLEVRREKAWRDPDPLTRSGAANTNPQEPAVGQYTTREAFVETNVPLLKDAMLADSLTLNAALRYSHYDLFDSSTNYKLGLNWQPLANLQVRTTRASAFRAPNIPELFAGEQKQNLITRDPCSNWSQLAPGSPVYQNCMAAGVPANYQQLVTSVLTTLGGNRNLNPEEAQTYGLGLDWNPDFAPLEFSLDYYKIHIDDAIIAIDGSSRLNACYNSGNLSHPFCASKHFTRNPASGEINYLSTQWVNAAEEEQSGLDLGIKGTWKLNTWQLGLDWQSSYLRNYQVTPYRDAAAIDYTGKVTSGRGSYLQYRSLARLSLTQGDWAGSYSLQYLGKGDALNAAPTSKGAQIPAVTYQHLQLSYQPGNYQLSLGVNNLFDRKAPYVINWLDVNTDTMTYDVAGRRWYLALGMNW